MYNRLMDESFDVCEKDNVDIYEIGLAELQPNMEFMGMMK